MYVCMSWPSQSPDINVIENLWLYIKRKLQTKVTRIYSNNDLFREIQKIWQEVTVAHI